MSIKREYNFDQVGDKDMYLLHHEEIESLAKNIPEAKRIRFFMTFGQSYLDHMRCLEDVGMLSTTPVNFNGQQIVPIKFLKALLPDPARFDPDPYLDALDKYGLPRPRAITRLWWTDAGARQPPALCGAGKPVRGAAAPPAHPLLSAGRSPAAPQRRDPAGGAAAHRLPHSAGAEGFFQLQCLPGAGTLSGRYRGQRPVREPLGQGRTAGEGEPCVLCRLPDR